MNESLIKQRLLQAWRSRTLPSDWATDTKSLASTTDTDLDLVHSLLLKVFLQQLSAGPAPSPALVSYLAHALANELVSLPQLIERLYVDICTASATSLTSHLKHKPLLHRAYMKLIATGILGLYYTSSKQSRHHEHHADSPRSQRDLPTQLQVAIQGTLFVVLSLQALLRTPNEPQTLEGSVDDETTMTCLEVLRDIVRDPKALAMIALSLYTHPQLYTSTVQVIEQIHAELLERLQQEHRLRQLQLQQQQQDQQQQHQRQPGDLAMPSTQINPLNHGIWSIWASIYTQFSRLKSQYGVVHGLSSPCSAASIVPSQQQCNPMARGLVETLANTAAPFLAHAPWQELVFVLQTHALDLATSSHTERLTARFQTLAATRNLSAASFLVQLFDAIAVLLAELPLGTPRSRIKQLLLIEVPRVVTLWPLSVEQVTSALATLVKRHAWFPGLRDTPHPALLSYRQYNAYSLLVEFLFVLDTRFDGATNAISLLPAEVFLEFIPFLATPFSVEAASHSSDVIPHTKPDVALLRSCLVGSPTVGTDMLLAGVVHALFSSPALQEELVGLLLELLQQPTAPEVSLALLRHLCLYQCQNRVSGVSLFEIVAAQNQLPTFFVTLLGWLAQTNIADAQFLLNFSYPLVLVVHALCEFEVVSNATNRATFMASVSNSNLLPVYTCVTQALLVHGPAPDLSVPNPTANQVLEALLAGKLEGVTPSELLDAMPSVASQLMLALKHGVIMQETLVTAVSSLGSQAPFALIAFCSWIAHELQAGVYGSATADPIAAVVSQLVLLCASDAQFPIEVQSTVLLMFKDFLASESLDTVGIAATQMSSSSFAREFLGGSATFQDLENPAVGAIHRHYHSLLAKPFDATALPQTSPQWIAALRSLSELASALNNSTFCSLLLKELMLLASPHSSGAALASAIRAAEVVGCIIGRIGVTAVIDFWARVVPLAIPMLTSRVHAELLAHVIAATCHATDIDRIQHHPDRTEEIQSANQRLMLCITELLERLGRSIDSVSFVVYFPLALLTLILARQSAYDVAGGAKQTDQSSGSLLSFAPTLRLAKALDALHYHHLVPALFGVSSPQGREQCIEYFCSAAE